MNILISVITYLVLAGIMVLGIFNGIKQGLVGQLTKLIVGVASIIGLYFLAPIVAPHFGVFLGNLFNSEELFIINFAVFKPLFMLVGYLFIQMITCITLIVVRASKRRKLQKAKVDARYTGGRTTVEKKGERIARRAERRAYRKAHKVRTAFAGIFGLISGAICGLLLLLPSAQFTAFYKAAGNNVNKLPAVVRYYESLHLDKENKLGDFMIGVNGEDTTKFEKELEDYLVDSAKLIINNTEHTGE